jgi:hypothetical protein
MAWFVTGARRMPTKTGTEAAGRGCQQQGEQLRFAAYLTDSNDEHRNNECFHGLAP